MNKAVKLSCWAAICAASVGFSSIGQAQDAFVPQVEASSRAISTFSISDDEPQPLNRREALSLIDLPSASSSADASFANNVALVHQAGVANQALSFVTGRNNATVQLQQGSGLRSNILFAGDDNSAIVGQSGQSLRSDIVVLGDNKDIVHLQLGAPAGTEGTIFLTGNRREDYVYVQYQDGSESLFRGSRR